MDNKLPPEVWLAGKGPHLDVYDWSQAGPCRVAINESVYIIPEPTHAVALDYDVQVKYMRGLPKGITVFRKQDHRAYKYPRMVLYKRSPAIKLVKCTAAIAIQLIALYGGRTIHFVGFDAIDNETTTYADSVEAIGARGINNDGFQRINTYIMAAINSTGIVPVWEHRNG